MTRYLVQTYILQRSIIHSIGNLLHSIESYLTLIICLKRSFMLYTNFSTKYMFAMNIL